MTAGMTKANYPGRTIALDEQNQVQSDLRSRYGKLHPHTALYSTPDSNKTHFSGDRCQIYLTCTNKLFH
jgi:hypothetical protein